MPWHSLTDLSTGQYVTETHMDHLRENVEFLGALKAGGSLVSALSAGAELGRPSIGSYTGNGSATQAITGLGITPRFLLIYPQSDMDSYLVGFKSSSDGTKTYVPADYADDHVISLDVGGFTLGDGTGSANGNLFNINAVVYSYVAWG